MLSIEELVNGSFGTILPARTFPTMRVKTPRALLSTSPEPETTAALGSWLSWVASVGVSVLKLFGSNKPLCRAVGNSHARLVLLPDLDPNWSHYGIGV